MKTEKKTNAVLRTQAWRLRVKLVKGNRQRHVWQQLTEKPGTCN